MRDLRMIRGLRRIATTMARTDTRLVSTVFLAGILFMAAPSLLGTWPVPAIHDEFGYLLAGDTFARGRLTNPTHRHWEHFETFHTIHRPSYMAKFPPAQGLALALGQVLTGRALAGVWISTAAACAATAWMLRAMVPARWALLGGLIAVSHQTVRWFSQSYWGGGMAMLGGALLGGAATRAMNRADGAGDKSFLAPATAMGIGMGILAMSRPLEGLIVAVCAMSYLAAVVIKARGFGPFVTRLLIPTLAATAPLLGWLGYYNWRVTGHAMTMPYSLHEREYMATPLFHFERPRTQPEYRFAELRNFHVAIEGAEYARYRTPGGYLHAVVEDIVTLLRAYVRPVALAVPLAGALLTFRLRDTRAALLICIALPLVHFLLTPWMRIQYMAPAAGYFIALIIIGLRHIAGMRNAKLNWGLLVATGVVVVHVGAGVAFAVSYNRRVPPLHGATRAQLVAQLEAQTGNHLVIVRYGPAHWPVQEWVFNAADIDSSRVVFARQINPAGDHALLDYFRDRHVWVLDVENQRIAVTRLR